jgi:hypothetical protein
MFHFSHSSDRIFELELDAPEEGRLQEEERRLQEEQRELGGGATTENHAAAAAARLLAYQRAYDERLNPFAAAYNPAVPSRPASSAVSAWLSPMSGGPRPWQAASPPHPPPPSPASASYSPHR